jgi:hypothetical protein
VAWRIRLELLSILSEQQPVSRADFVSSFRDPTILGGNEIFRGTFDPAAGAQKSLRDCSENEQYSAVLWSANNRIPISKVNLPAQLVDRHGTCGDEFGKCRDWHHHCFVRSA